MTKRSWNLEEGAPLAEGRTVLRPLGGGRRYEVFLVWDERLFFPAVAKVLRPECVDDERARRIMRREAGLLERLAHPILVRGLGAFHDGPHPHLLLEQVDGPNLRQLILEHGALPLEDVLPAALDVLAALHYLSAEGVVHLDVKPSNIVLGDPTRLIDIGSARSLAEAAERRKPIGTASYMSPEQCAPPELGPLGPPADVWGLGAALYHALTGNRPFSPPGAAGSDPAERYPQLVEDPLPVPDYVPEPVANVVLRMLARRPGDRPTAAEAAEALDPLAAAVAAA